MAEAVVVDKNDKLDRTAEGGGGAAVEDGSATSDNGAASSSSAAPALSVQSRAVRAR